VTTIALPRTCDRAAARALLPDIRDAVGPQPAVVDASAVERIGQAMLQLLVAAARSESGITLAAPSTAFAEAATLAGLAAVLGCEAGEPAALTSGENRP
jgi:anti-anti-sigma regulatory factor